MSERQHKIARIFADFPISAMGVWSLPGLIQMRAYARKGGLGQGWQAAPTPPAPFIRTMLTGEGYTPIPDDYPNRAQRRDSLAMFELGFRLNAAGMPYRSGHERFVSRNHAAAWQ